LPIPDYALDMHTQKGRKMGRVGPIGVMHFLEEGAKIRKKFKNRYKRTAEGFLINHGTAWLKFPEGKEAPITNGSRRKTRRHVPLLVEYNMKEVKNHA